MPDSTSSQGFRGPRPGPRATAGLLQLLLWAGLAGFYAAWLSRPGFLPGGPHWPLVLMQLGFAIILFNGLVYLIIPRWLMRGHYGRALAGGGALFLFYRVWEYGAARLALAHLSLSPELRKFFQQQYVDIFWGYFTTFYGVMMTSISLLANMLPPVLVSFLAYALVVDRRRLGLERDRLRLELSYLKAQVNPQFLFNTLGSLRALTEARDARAGDVVLHLADLLRYTLYETDAERVPLARELEFLADYLALERLRHPGVSITHEVLGTATAQPLAPLLLHPFLERLFAGLGAGSVGSVVRVGPAEVALTLVRTAAAPVPPPYGTDPAVVAALRRLQLQYPGRHTVQLSEADGQVRVHLRILF